MGREKTIVFILMLMFLSLNIISGTVSATGMKKEDMTWSIGDKWEYRYTTMSEGMNMILIMTAKTTGESNIDIDGVNYDVFVAAVSGNLETVDATSLGASLVQGSTISGTMYVAKENEATSKTTQNLEYQLRQDTSGKFFNFTQTIVTVTRAISGVRPDVIDVGTSWNSTLKIVTTTTTTMSGSYFDTNVEPGYTNTSTTTDDRTENLNYECIGKENITTTAGTFETYVINKTKVGDEGYTIQYLSSTVKGEVKDTEYDSYGNMLAFTELISYGNEPVTIPPSTKTKTPGFELVIVFCSIAVILFLKRKRI